MCVDQSLGHCLSRLVQSFFRPLTHATLHDPVWGCRIRIIALVAVPCGIDGCSPHFPAGGVLELRSGRKPYIPVWEAPQPLWLASAVTSSALLAVA